MWPKPYLGKPTGLSRMPGNSHSSMKTLMEIKKKRCVLLKDEAPDWLQIWITASSLDLKSKKAILFFSLTGSFVYVRAQAGVKFGIHFTICSENGNMPSLLQQVKFIPKFHFC